MNIVEFLIVRAKFAGLAGMAKPVIESLKITENGTYTAPDGVDGYNPIRVLVEAVADGETSGSPLAFASGYFTPTADRTRMTIEHGLGVMPDFVMVYMFGLAGTFDSTEELVDANPTLVAWGFRSAFDTEPLSGMNLPGWGFTNQYYGIDNMPADARELGHIYCPDDSVFQVGKDGGDGAVGLIGGQKYGWVAVSGIGSGAAEPVIEPLEVTENGTYEPPEGVDGYNPVTVNVPAPEVKLQEKTITENGEYTADSGFDGLGKVLVDVMQSGASGELLVKQLSFKPTSTKGVRVECDIGFKPDILLVYISGHKTVTTYNGIMYYGISKALANKLGVDGSNSMLEHSSSSVYFSGYSTDIQGDYDASIPISAADATGFNLGKYAPVNMYYSGIAIGGLS